VPLEWSGWSRERWLPLVKERWVGAAGKARRCEWAVEIAWERTVVFTCFSLYLNSYANIVQGVSVVLALFV
jgi:hypothetical protein